MSNARLRLGVLCFTLWCVGCLRTTRPADAAASPEEVVDSLVVEWDAPPPADLGLDRPRRDAARDVDLDQTPEDEPAPLLPDVPVRDEPAGEDGPPPPPLENGCAPAPIEAADVGVRFGAMTVLHVRASQLTRGSVARVLDGDCVAPRSTSHWFAVRYAPRADAHLSLSLVPSSHARRVPRFVLANAAVFTGCEDPASARRAACGGLRDPLLREEFYRRLPSAAFVTRERLPAGRPVVVLIGLDPEDVTLRVTEVVDEVPAGGSCDSQGLGNTCAPGATCAFRNGSFTDPFFPGAPDGAWECRPDGALDAQCLPGGRCAAGLTCVTALSGSARDSCQEARRVGEACGREHECVGGTCVIGLRGATCVAAGGRYARCRAEGPRCDPGLRCELGRATWEPLCIPAVAPGAPCSDNAHTLCPDGEACVAAPGGARCRTAGVDGGPCRTVGRPCDDGLRCDQPAGNGGACRPWLGEGDACERFSRQLEPCGPGLQCAGRRCVSATGPRAWCDDRHEAGECAPDEHCEGNACVRDGASGGRCRASAPPCDTGLLCSPYGLCAPPADRTGSTLSTCPSGQRREVACEPDGARGGWCRAGPRPCDGDLLCVGDYQVPGASKCIDAGAGPGACVSNGLCVAGQRCDDAEAFRCAPASSFEPCVSGACPASKRCVNGLCRVVAAEGARCSDTTVCAPGSSCVFDFTRFRPLCRRDRARGGACGGDGGCDPGLRCEHVFGGDRTWELCTSESATGGPCGGAVLCDGRSVCYAGRCVAIGRLGERCRREAPLCDAGLSCFAGECREVVSGVGTPCDYCAPPLFCYGPPGGMSRCSAPVYDVTTGEGAALEDPCSLPPYGGGPPFTFTASGRTDTLMIEDDGELTLRSIAGGDGVAFGPVFGDIAEGLAEAWSCRRVVGTAPRRRLIVGRSHFYSYLQSTSGRDPVLWELVLYEGTNVVEFRYMPLTLQRAHSPFRVWPTFYSQRASTAVDGGLLARAGAWVRLTPR